MEQNNELKQISQNQYLLCLLCILFYALPTGGYELSGCSSAVFEAGSCSMDISPFSPYAGRRELFMHLWSYVVEAKIPGDYVETGVFQGESAYFTARMLKCSNHLNITLWLYDSWLGMPEATHADGPGAKFFVGWGRDSSLDGVKKRLSHAGWDVQTNTVFRKGWFNVTFKQPKPATLAFLHIDSDWYNSVYSTLDTFYDLVLPGGVVLFDDFGAWEGTRKAFYDFFHQRKEYPLLERNGRTQTWFIKGKEHNRHTQQRYENKTFLESVRKFSWCFAPPHNKF